MRVRRLLYLHQVSGEVMPKLCRDVVGYVTSWAREQYREAFPAAS